MVNLYFQGENQTPTQTQPTGHGNESSTLVDPGISLIILVIIAIVIGGGYLKYRFSPARKERIQGFEELRTEIRILLGELRAAKATEEEIFEKIRDVGGFKSLGEFVEKLKTTNDSGWLNSTKFYLKNLLQDKKRQLERETGGVQMHAREISAEGDKEKSLELLTKELEGIKEKREKLNVRDKEIDEKITRAEGAIQGEDVDEARGHIHMVQTFLQSAESMLQEIKSKIELIELIGTESAKREATRLSGDLKKKVTLKALDEFLKQVREVYHTVPRNNNGKK